MKRLIPALALVFSCKSTMTTSPPPPTDPKKSADPQSYTSQDSTIEQGQVHEQAHQAEPAAAIQKEVSASVNCWVEKNATGPKHHLSCRIPADHELRFAKKQGLTHHQDEKQKQLRIPLQGKTAEQINQEVSALTVAIETSSGRTLSTPLNDILSQDNQFIEQLEQVFRLLARYQFHRDKPTLAYDSFNRSGVSLIKSFLTELKLTDPEVYRWCYLYDKANQELTLFSKQEMGVGADNQGIIRSVSKTLGHLRSKSKCDDETQTFNNIKTEFTRFAGDLKPDSMQILQSKSLAEQEVDTFYGRLSLRNHGQGWVTCQTKFTVVIQKDSGEEKIVEYLSPTHSPRLIEPGGKQATFDFLMEVFHTNTAFLKDKTRLAIQCLPCNEKDTSLCYDGFPIMSLHSSP